MIDRYSQLRTIDARLAAQGGHGLTPWWQAQLGRWYASGTRRFVGRVGRGGIKSTTAARVALVEVLFGEWPVPPGEVHYFAFVSASKAEAGQRLRQIAEMLRALGVAFDQSGDEIVIPELRRGVRVFAATVGAVSGFRCFGFCADELAKWTSADSAANPAPEVIASLRAMCVTHPGAREFLISSPLGLTDFHAQAFDRGDSEQQVVAFAPTWIANPSVTEAHTRDLEPDERIWAREYAAQPQAGALAVFTPAAIERAFSRPRAGERSDPVIVIDASSGRKDTFAFGVASWATPASTQPDCLITRWRTVPCSVLIDGMPHASERTEEEHFVRDATGQLIPYRPTAEPPFLSFDLIDGFEGRFADQVSSDQVVAQIAQVAREYGARHVHGDQRESYTLASLFRRHGLRFVEHPWTATTKPDAVAHVRRLMTEGRIALPEHERLRRELHSFEERFTPSGSLTFGARGSGHDDYVALLITGAMADLGGHVRGSPYRVGRASHEIPDYVTRDEN